MSKPDLVAGVPVLPLKIGRAARESVYCLTVLPLVFTFLFIFLRGRLLWCHFILEVTISHCLASCAHT